MKKETNKKVFRVIITAIILIALSWAVFTQFSSGTNLTDEYHLYTNVKNAEDIDTLRNYLDKKQISYEIESSRLTLKKFDNISFAISGNKCSILKNAHMLSCEKLDSENYEELHVESTYAKDGMTEKILLKIDGKKYMRLDNVYYMSDIMAKDIANTILVVSCITIGVFFTVKLVKSYKKNHTTSTVTNVEY